MRVLFINSVCGIRSTGRICTDIAEVLSRQGHECKIAYGREYVPEMYKDIAVRIGTDFDTKIHGLQTRILDNTGFASKNATKKFIKWVMEYNPDIIHLHNLHGYYINIKVLFDYLAMAGKPVVWTLHDCWSFTGHCTHFDYVNCEKWKTHCYACPQKKQYPASFFYDGSTSNFMRKKGAFLGLKHLTIITPSYWLAGLVKQSFLKNYPIEVIHNGINLFVFKPTPSDFREKHCLQRKYLLLGVAGVWEERKGLNFFLDLAPLLQEDEHIVLVGLTEKIIAELMLPGNITAIPKTNKISELAEIYTASDVFINPTLEDNYPTTNLEAIACGTPVIAFDTGGNKEIVNEKNGCILAEKTTKAILAAVHDRKHLVKLSERLEKKGDSKLEGLDKEVCTANYLRIYQKSFKARGENPQS